MPKRTILRLTTAASLTVAGCSATSKPHPAAPPPTPPVVTSPQIQTKSMPIQGQPELAEPATTQPATTSPTTGPTTATTLPATLPSLPATAPALPSMEPMGSHGSKAAVITPPAAGRSSTQQSHSYNAHAIVPGSVAASTTHPTPAPTTESTASAAATVPPLHPAPPSTQPIPIAADAQLAERFCSLAQASIPTKVQNNAQWPALFQRSGALLSAAVKLNPTEGRFARLLADVMLQSHDDKGAIDALNKARTADPADQLVQVQLIDLYTNRMETAGDKIKYYKNVMGRPGIPEPVRSHAGVACAMLLRDRGQPDTATKVLSEALRLNPLNATALRLRYDMLPAKATNFERCEALMEMLRANPAQPAVAAALADRLASVGIVDDSLPWYNLATRVYSQQRRPNLDLALNLACELYIAGQTGTAANVVDQLCKVSPDASGNWFLKILLARASGKTDAVKSAIQQSINAMSNTLLELLPQAKDQQPATTRPISSTGAYPLPDLSPGIAQARQYHGPGAATKLERLELALADLATLHAYFTANPTDAEKLVAALKQLNPKNTAIDRIDGFIAVSNGNTAARKFFQACRGKDPLGEMGLVQLEGKNKSNTESASLAGRTLLNDHPSGLLGAFLVDGLRNLNVQIIRSKQADDLLTQVKKFPTNWLRVVDTPQNFYGVRIDPIEVACDYGQPLLARLTVLNLTNSPLPIGTDALLKPDLWFNARVVGLGKEQYGSIAYDRLAGPLLLGPGQSFSQTIRLDQGPLQQLLDSNYEQTIEITGDVTTNPQPVGNGQVVAGPAGYHVVFAHLFSRAAEPMNSEAAQRSLSAITSGTPQDKFDAIDLLGAYLRAIAASKHSNDPGLQQAAGTFGDALHQAMSDPTGAVAAWASLVYVESNPSSNTTQQVIDLSHAPDWRIRQAALIASGSLSQNDQQQMAKALSTDPEPSVRTAALARLKYFGAATKP